MADVDSTNLRKSSYKASEKQAFFISAHKKALRIAQGLYHKRVTY